MKRFAAASAQDRSADLIPLGDGLNFASPLHLVDGTVVPSELFFLRSNFPPPNVTQADWTLRVAGRVRRPLQLGLRDVQALPKISQDVWLECAGNSRSRFERPTEGNQWGDTAVGDAVFAGASLRHVLEMADVESEAIELVTTGFDSPSFQRGLPLDVALRPEVLLAWEMNGEPIPDEHGGPVRLVVPRWAGIASVKWPMLMELVDTPFTGHFNAERYIVVDADGVTRRTVREMPVKSIIAWPTEGAVVPRGEHVVFGFAWSGHGQIERVEVSVDGQRTWCAARLIAGQGPLAWTRWELPWLAAQAGDVSLAVRATDTTGQTQPEQVAWNEFGYEMNAIHTRTVHVSG